MTLFHLFVLASLFTVSLAKIDMVADKVCTFKVHGSRPKEEKDYSPPTKEIVIITDLYKVPGTMEKIKEETEKTLQDNEALTFCSLRDLAKKYPLPVAAKDIAGFADPIADMFINRDIKFNAEESHFICEGFAAHICGAIGRKIILLAAPQKVGRITGLDPLGVCFDPNVEDRCRDQSNLAETLSRECAHLVDVLFTGREYWSFCQVEIESSKAEMCHACFFANGGFRQPGCGGRDTGNLGTACSHWRAAEIWLEAVTSPGAFNTTGCQLQSDNFLGVCERSFTNFGPEMAKGTEGIFGFATKCESPYAVPLVCWTESATDDGKVKYTDCYIESHW